jgi:hypothetical protein
LLFEKGKKIRGFEKQMLDTGKDKTAATGCWFPDTGG